MFVGYPEDTTSDVYRLLNLQTKAIIKSKDILWLHETYGTYTKTKNPMLPDATVTIPVLPNAPTPISTPSLPSPPPNPFPALSVSYIPFTTLFWDFLNQEGMI